MSLMEQELLTLPEHPSSHSSLSWVRVVLVIHLNVFMFVSDLRQLVDGFFRVPRCPPPIKLTPRYYWNIVESGVKHLKPTTTAFKFRVMMSA